jgi:type I restriction enzyme S subunit
MKQFDLESMHLNMLREILEPLSGRVFAYGSRVKGTASKFSDLDLCYLGQIDKHTIRSIKEKLRESNLPIKVDLISYDEASSEFRELIKNDLVLIG